MRYLSCGGDGRRFPPSVGDKAGWRVDDDGFDTHAARLDLPYILSLA